MHCGLVYSVPVRCSVSGVHSCMGTISRPFWSPGYAAYQPGYPMPAPEYAILSALRRGPESCGSKSRGSRGSSNRSLTRSELREALRGATADLAGDITQENRDKLDPLIPPQGSPTTLAASPDRLQANQLVAALRHTLAGLRSRPMPTPAVVPSGTFVPRTPSRDTATWLTPPEQSWTSLDLQP